MREWPEHHATGSGPDGFLDPDLRIAIPREAHDEIHVLWRSWRFERPNALRPGPPRVAKVELRLRRLGPTVRVAAGLVAADACCAHSLIVAAIAAFLFLLADHVEVWADDLADFLQEGDAP